MTVRAMENGKTDRPKRILTPKQLRALRRNIKKARAARAAKRQHDAQHPVAVTTNGNALVLARQALRQRVKQLAVEEKAIRRERRKVNRVAHILAKIG